MAYNSGYYVGDVDPVSTMLANWGLEADVQPSRAADDIC